VEANSLVDSGNKTGALSFGGSAFKIPGSKNVAGETLVPALMPLQPELNSASTISIASHRKFQFNLTCPV
jgi:hypothetical protein